MEFEIGPYHKLLSAKQARKICPIVCIPHGGHQGDAQKACMCAPAVVTQYQKCISCPLLNRIDIHCEVPRVWTSGDRMRKTSESIRKRVQAARNIQQQRLAGSQSDII